MGEPQPHRGVDVLAGREPGRVQAIASNRYGISSRFTMKPASSPDRTHVLPRTSVPKSRTNAKVSSLVSLDGVSSRSAITGGVEEVHPDHAIGPTARPPQLPDRDRGRVRREDDLGTRALPEASEDPLWHADPRSRPRSRGRRRRARPGRWPPRSVRGPRGRRPRRASRARRPSRPTARRGRARRPRAPRPLHERHGQTRAGAHLDDPGAHRTAADHAHVADVLRSHGPEDRRPRQPQAWISSGYGLIASSITEYP